MSSDARTHPTHRARPVADAPVQPLLARTDELARRWAIALILALPLERIGEIPLESFAREAPGFLAQVLRALRSDAELTRLADPGSGARPDLPPAPRLGELTGAGGGQAAVEAIEALRGVLWEALLDELRLPSFHSSPAREVADLADRLAYVCSVALGSTLARAPDPEARAGVAPEARAGVAPEARAGVAPEVTVRRAAPAPPTARRAAPAPPPPAPAPALKARELGALPDRAVIVEPPEHAARASLGRGVAIVDEAEPVLRRAARGRAPGQPQPASASAERQGHQAAAAGARRARAQGRARPWDIPLDATDDADPRTAGPGGEDALDP